LKISQEIPKNALLDVPVAVPAAVRGVNSYVNITKIAAAKKHCSSYCSTETNDY
jgi:hypothetical protein